MNLHNNKHLKQFRKDLRNNGTAAEATLWKSLQKRQLDGYKFRRQHSVVPFILDFYCPKAKLAIELDGAHHFTEEGQAKDLQRDAYLADQGIKVLHFENKLIFNNHFQVLESIRNGLNQIIMNP